MHCARHTFVTLSRANGMDYDVISRLVGHRDAKTTKIYSNYQLELLVREMRDRS